MSHIDKSFVIAYLSSCTRLFEAIPQLEESLDGDRKGVYSLIKGAVQSGKSAIIHSLILYLHLVLNHRVAVILRNYLHDYEQFERGFSLFCQDFYDWCGECDMDVEIGYADHPDENTPGVMVGLFNKSQLSKLKHHMLSAEYSVIIDEVDQLMYSDGYVTRDLFQALLDKSSHNIGVSATLYDPLQDGRFDMGQVFYLLPPINYRGVQHIIYRDIDPLDSTEGPILMRDRSLYQFLYDHRMHPGYGHNPFLCLIKNERLIADQERLLQEIIHDTYLYNNYTAIVYNGREALIYSCFPLALPNRVGDDMYVCRSTSIQSVLQYLKINGGVDKFPRIVIIAHNLVGRGINVVSLDFKWHLTHMFYRPSASATIPTIIQSMRLCGIYHDTIDLTCYMTEEDRQELHKGYLLQEEIFDRIRDAGHGTQKTDVFLKKETFHRDKIPKKKIGKSGRFVGMIVDGEESGCKSSSGVDYNKLRRWVNQDSLLGKMIRYLYGQDGPIRVDTLRRECGYEGSKKSFQSAIDNGCSRRANYGKLWIQHLKYIMLNPEVRQWLTTNCNSG